MDRPILSVKAKVSDPPSKHPKLPFSRLWNRAGKKEKGCRASPLPVCFLKCLLCCWLNSLACLELREESLLCGVLAVLKSIFVSCLVTTYEQVPYGSVSGTSYSQWDLGLTKPLILRVQSYGVNRSCEAVRVKSLVGVIHKNVFGTQR